MRRAEINLDTSELSLQLEELNAHLIIEITRGRFQLDEKIWEIVQWNNFVRARCFREIIALVVSNCVTNAIVRRKFIKVASMNTNENTPWSNKFR